MFYFIPAWYDNDVKWGLFSLPWYRQGVLNEFDDTINQIKMFQQSETSTCLLILNYSPHLRYFLKRQNLLETHVCSLFDKIQNIENVPHKMLSIHDFNWPNDVEFIYTAFLITVLQKGNLLANVEFGVDGQIVWITFFKDDKIDRQYYIDDRGFLSSVIYYEDGKIHRQEFLDLNGNCQMTQYAEAFHKIQLCENHHMSLKKVAYANLDELFLEYLTYFNKTEREDVFIIASHEHHNKLVYQALSNQVIVTSFFANRYPLEHTQGIINSIQNSQVVITDTVFLETKLKEVATQNTLIDSHIYHLPPLDTRLKLGLSQRLKESRLYIQADNISDEQLTHLLQIVVDKMDSYPVELLFVSSISDEDVLKNKIVNKLNDLNLNDVCVIQTNKNESITVLDDDDDDIQSEIVKIYIQRIINELDLIKTMKYTRLIIDLSEQPNIFLQIAGISAGIPQINVIETHYVVHCENGYILSDINQLSEALDYYLKDLKHWNESLVHSVILMNQYNSGELVKKWQYYITKGEMRSEGFINSQL